MIGDHKEERIYQKINQWKIPLDPLPAERIAAAKSFETARTVLEREGTELHGILVIVQVDLKSADLGLGDLWEFVREVRTAPRDQTFPVSLLCYVPWDKGQSEIEQESLLERTRSRLVDLTRQDPLLRRLQRRTVTAVSGDNPAPSIPADAGFRFLNDFYTDACAAAKELSPLPAPSPPAAEPLPPPQPPVVEPPPTKPPVEPPVAKPLPPPAHPPPPSPGPEKTTTMLVVNLHGLTYTALRPILDNWLRDQSKKWKPETGPLPEFPLSIPPVGTFMEALTTLQENPHVHGALVILPIDDPNLPDLGLGKVDEVSARNAGLGSLWEFIKKVKRLRGSDFPLSLVVYVPWGVSKDKVGERLSQLKNKTENLPPEDQIDLHYKTVTPSSEDELFPSFTEDPRMKPGAPTIKLLETLYEAASRVTARSAPPTGQVVLPGGEAPQGPPTSPAGTPSPPSAKQKSPAPGSDEWKAKPELILYAKDDKEGRDNKALVDEFDPSPNRALLWISYHDRYRQRKEAPEVARLGFSLFACWRARMSLENFVVLKGKDLTYLLKELLKQGVLTPPLLKKIWPKDQERPNFHDPVTSKLLKDLRFLEALVQWRRKDLFEKRTRPEEVKAKKGEEIEAEQCHIVPIAPGEFAVVFLTSGPDPSRFYPFLEVSVTDFGKEKIGLSSTAPEDVRIVLQSLYS